MRTHRISMKVISLLVRDHMAAFLWMIFHLHRGLAWAKLNDPKRHLAPGSSETFTHRPRSSRGITLKISVAPHELHAVVTLVGRLDTAGSPAVLDRLNAQIDAGRLHIVLDLTSVDYISSSGLRVLLMAQKRLTASDGYLLLCGINEYVREVFDVAGFMSLFPVYSDQKSALEALK